MTKWLPRLLSLLLSLASAPAAPAQLRCLEHEGAIEVHRGDALVLRYNKQPTAAAAENDPAYSRTGYIHPLCTPAGRIVTS